MLGPVKFFLQLKILFVHSKNEKMKHCFTSYYTSVNKFSFLGKPYTFYIGTQARRAKTGPFLDKLYTRSKAVVYC